MSISQTNFIEYSEHLDIVVRSERKYINQGYANTPYPWQPSVVHIQILRVGQLVILVVPGEFTTMSGRRIRCA